MEPGSRESPRDIFPKLSTAAGLLTHPAHPGRDLGTCRRFSEQPHLPLSTVMLMEMMNVTLNTLKRTSDSRSLGVYMYHREEMILQ